MMSIDDIKEGHIYRYAGDETIATLAYPFTVLKVLPSSRLICVKGVGEEAPNLLISFVSSDYFCMHYRLAPSNNTNSRKLTDMMRLRSQQLRTGVKLL